MKKISVLLLMLITQGCLPKGYINDYGVYRAKKPNYSLYKIPFVQTNLIDYDYLYLTDPVQKVDFEQLNKVTGSVSGIRFFNDGRAILNGYDYEKRYGQSTLKNSWKTAFAAGYFRVNGSQIKVEFLFANSYGTYEIREGQIKGDSILLEPNKNRPSLTFVKSNLSSHN